MQKPVQRAPSVRLAFRTFWRTLRHGYENLATLGIASLLWWVFTVPIAAPVLVVFYLTGILADPLTVLLLGIALMMVGVGPPTAALHRIAQPMSEERASRWTPFWSYVRADWRWSLLLVGTLLLILLLLDVNRRFYGAAFAGFLPFFTVFFFVFTVVWIGILFFAIPLALRQSNQRVRTTLRNAVIIVLANLPGVLVSLVLLLSLCLLLSLLVPLILFMPGLIALWAEENVRLLLVASGIIPPDEFADSWRNS